MMIQKRRKKRLTIGILVCAHLFSPLFAEDHPASTQDTLPVLPLAGESPRKLSVDLKQAVEIALSDNPTILVAGQEIALKKEVKKEALAGLLPGVELTGSYSRTLKKQTMVMEMDGQPMSIQVGTDNSYTGGVTVSLPVFAPALYRSINLTGTDIQLAVEKSRSSRLDMVNQVTKAYYQLLLAQDSYDVLLKSYAQAEANFEIVNEKYGLGSVSEYDKIRADVQVRSLKPNVVSARNAVNLTKLQLKTLMGLNEEVEIEIQGNLKDYESGLFERRETTAELNLADNTELRQLELNADLLEKNLKLQKANFLPVLAASYSYMYTSLNNDFAMAHYNWFPYSFVGLNLSIPLFKGGNFPKLRQVKIQIGQLEQTRIHTERLLYMQMSSYLDNMSASSEQVASNKESILQAEKGQMIAQKRYDVGKGTILELNDSEVALTQAQLIYNQSIYDYLVAKADLEKVLGRDEMITETNK
jgi:outer membrane protein TolC